MAMFRSRVKDGFTVPVVFQGASSKTTDDLVKLRFENYDDDSKAVYPMAEIGVADEGARRGLNVDGLGSLCVKTGSGGVLAPVLAVSSRGTVEVGGGSNVDEALDGVARLIVRGPARFGVDAEGRAGASLADSGDLTLEGGGSVVFGAPGLSLPDPAGGRDLQVLVHGAAGEVRYAHARSDTVPVAPVTGRYGPPEDLAPLAGAPAPLPIFSRAVLGDDRRLLPSPGGLALSVARSDRPLLCVLQSGTRALQQGGAAGASAAASVGASRVGATAHTSHVLSTEAAEFQQAYTAFAVSPSDPDAAVASGLPVEPAGGAYRTDPDLTRFSALAVEPAGSAFCAQALALGGAALEEDAPRAFPLGPPRVSAGDLFAPLEGGFAATRAGAAVVLASAVASGGPAFTVNRLELNGQPLGGVLHYSGYSAGRATTSVAAAVLLAPGDEVRSTHALYRQNGAQALSGSLEELCVTAFEADPADLLQIYATAPGGVRFPSNQPIVINTPAPELIGSSFSYDGALETAVGGIFAVFGGATFADDTASQREACTVSASALDLSGDPIAQATGMLVENNRLATVSFAGVRELGPGNTLRLQIFSDRPVSVTSVSLTVLRLRPPSPEPLAAGSALLPAGAFRRHAELDRQISRVGGLPQDCLALNTGEVPEGLYWAEASADLRRVLDTPAEHSLVLDGSVVLASGSALAAAAGADASINPRARFRLAAGGHSLALRINGAGGAAGACTVPRASLTFFRLQ